MKLRFRNSKQKGVALAFALMTALLLMTLSTTVVGLSMRHARSGSESDYAQEALHAADWYLNAALDYMKGDGTMGKDGTPSKSGVAITHKDTHYLNPYTDWKDTSFRSLSYGNDVLGRTDVSAEAIPLTSDQAKEYNMTLGSTNNPTLVRFKQYDNNPLVYFPADDVADGYKVNDRFAVCDVVIEKNDPASGPYGTRGTPALFI